MRHLLTHLAQFSAFSKQGEVLCNRGLEYLLETADAREKFQNLLDYGPQRLVWRAELRQKDGARPDLEGLTERGIPIVKVEAKIGASFAPGQLRSYVDDMVQRGGAGLLVLLVPEYRIAEAQALAAKTLLPESASTRVLSWSSVIQALHQVDSDHFASDLRQFEAMYRVLAGMDIEPLANEAAVLAWREREDAFIHFIDRATRALSPRDRLLPLGLDGRKPEETEKPNSFHSYYRRYVACDPDPRPTFYSLGVRDPFVGHTTPIWLRFHRDTPRFTSVRERLQPHGKTLNSVLSEGHIWIPLTVPVQAPAQAVVDSLVRETLQIRDLACPANS